MPCIALCVEKTFAKDNAGGTEAGAFAVDRVVKTSTVVCVACKKIRSFAMDNVAKTKNEAFVVHCVACA